ncbi:LysR family transcriptional regulator [Helicovermis profundi]|uniref:LysR family transcriptional regulator n=1 Tax=Helicovermis profundi TaxID=3065157 RepID=A0AAU9E162_9FIRM|nr:LysR family transcriptional regulator [Clostridia bacterium S502]
MDIKYIMTFLKVAELNSFTKTAEELQYSQSTISFHIQSLEKELNVRLFERVGKNLKITYEGQHILNTCKQLRDNYYNLLDLTSNIENTNTPIQIGTVGSFLIYILSNVIKKFKSIHPSVNIQLNSSPSNKHGNLIKDNSIDLAFFVQPDLSDTTLNLTLLKRESMYLIYPNNFDFKSYQYLADNLTACISEPGCSYRAIFSDFHTNHHIQYKASIESWSIEMIKHCVLSGIGYSILPQMCINDEIKNKSFQFILLDPEKYYIDLTLAYKKDRILPTQIKHFIELVKDEMQ